MSADMSGVALVAHHRSDRTTHCAELIAQWCAERGVAFWIVPADATAIDLERYADDRSPQEADLVVSLGGDGTMLRSVHLLSGAPIPLLGVNLGSLGYLTEIEPDFVAAALGRFFAGPEQGEWRLDERMMLDVAVDGEPAGRALNEAVVEKSRAGNTVRLLARIDGEPFTYYAADGLIVATPTGSTAYSLSARGPIVSPRHRAMLLTPVSPHMLFDRTLVLDPSEVVEIELSGHRDAEVVIDGRSVGLLGNGGVVRCAPSAATARFVRFGISYYHQILKAKLGLFDR